MMDRRSKRLSGIGGRIVAMVAIVLSFQFLFFNSQLGFAQSFSSLWKQVKTAEEKDQPKSALEAIHKIERKAEKEGSYGNLLAAMLKELMLQNEVSPDSLDSAKQRLTNKQSVWRNSGKGVEATLADVALGKIDENGNDNANRNENWIDSLLHSPDSALYRSSNKAQEYVPLIKTGEDSKYFNNDLLSLIIMAKDNGIETTNKYASLYGEDNKVVQWRRTLEAIDTVRDTGKKIALIDKALAEWKNWKSIDELRNQRNQLTQPTYEAEIANSVVSTRKEVKMSFRQVRNVSGLNVRLSNKKGETRTFRKTFEKKQEWEYIEKDSLSIGTLPYGEWMVNILDEKTGIKVEERKLYVTDLRIIAQRLPQGKTRIAVVDATTGAPAEGATIHYSKAGVEKKQTKTCQTNKDGEAILSAEPGEHQSYRYTLRATKGEDSYMPEDVIWTSYSQGGTPKALQTYINLFTDRAIYRRGHTVHVTAICHNMYNSKEPRVAQGEKITLSLHDKQGKELAEKVVATDLYGTATADFTIPEEGVNGNYGVRAKCGTQGETTTVNRASAYTTIKVEDYKRPSFKVTLNDDGNGDANANRNGNANEKDTVIVRGEAKTYSGVPVANARVAYTVKRNSSWWIARYGEELSNDTLYTDADGKFFVKVPTTLPEDVDTTWYYCYRYTLKAQVTDNGGETQNATITLTRKNDRPVKPQEPESPRMLSASAESFSANVDEPVVITMRDVAQKAGKTTYAYYTICSGNEVIDKGKIEFRDSTTCSFTYKEEYGDGICYSVGWVKDGNLYNDNVKVKKYLPSKKLSMEWGTFRDKLYPGQTETWTLKVKNPDGTPSKAQVMAVMYDKSLDALQKLDWNLADRRNLYIPYTNWQTNNMGYCYFWGAKTLKHIVAKQLEFNHINPEYMFRGGYYSPFAGVRMFKTRGLAKGAILYETADAKVMSANAPIGSFDVAQEESIVVGYGVKGNDEGEEEENVEMRSDFSETAFFLPQVEADKNGIATLRFTMPESVTTWRFMAIAHDKDMGTALMDTTALTQKKLMVQGKMPRFIRKEDKATVGASIANLTEKKQRVVVSLVVKDAETEKTIYKEKKTVSTEAGKTADVTFKLPEQEKNVLCSFIAEMPGFSDGEQHLLPVLTNEFEEKKDTATITVNPRKMMMEALPAMQVPASQNAVTLAQAYYANILAAHVKDTIVSAANDNVLAQLLNLQNADGGFSWYGGMRSNRFITIEVLKTLARLNLMTGKQQRTEYMMDKASRYAKVEMEREMQEMKKYKVRYLSQTALDWLYTLAISGRDGGSAESFFRKMIYEQTKYDDMQTKAVAAITLNQNGKQKKAEEFAEAIKQHTVYREDMGRYFDSYRAQYSWCDYRIPTHTMCIEALKDVTPEDGQTINEMLRWLVSAKRTQRWDNPINTINAVYALYNSKDTTMLSTYTVKPEDIQGALKITRTLKGEKKKGSKVKVTLTIEADRDYDFVTVTDNRAACLEPVNQLSGYRWGAYRGYYAEMRDSKSVYHFDQLAKGTYVVETEYYIDREGEYQFGDAEVVCEYAPEFRGWTKGTKLKIEN